jgi:hypothetical protein
MPTETPRESFAAPEPLVKVAVGAEVDDQELSEVAWKT